MSQPSSHESGLTLEAARARDADRLRQDLLFALSRVPEHGLIFSRPEVDKIADALGGYTALRNLLVIE